MKPVVLPELRLRGLWLCVGVAIAVIIATMSLLPSRHLPDVNVSDKIEHALAFLLLAFWFGSIVVRRDYLWLALAVLAFGGLIELVQGWMGLGRRADLLDLGADAIGIVGGLLLALTPLGRWARWLELRFGQAAP
jgi:hypothetical protein